MANITGQGRPTRTLKANKGDIYTDANTGIKYECLGPDGFVDVEGVDEPEYYDWKEIKSAGGGGASDCDWNIMKNKPFGDPIVGERQVCFENKQVNFVQLEDMSGGLLPYARWMNDEANVLNDAKLGDLAVIVLDGVEHIYKCETSTGNDKYFGNIAIINDQNESSYPDDKILCSLAAYGGVFFVDASLAGDHELSVYLCETDVTRLDNKYIQDSVMIAGEASWEDLPDRPFGDFGGVGTYLETLEITFNENGQFYLMDSGLLTTVNWGDKVIYNFDGTEYECEVNSTTGTNWFGNPTLDSWPGDYTQPINLDHPILVIPDGMQTTIYAPELAGTSHTFSVQVDTRHTKTIDEKYIPEFFKPASVIGTTLTIYAGETNANGTPTRSIDADCDTPIIMYAYYTIDELGPDGVPTGTKWTKPVNCALSSTSYTDYDGREYLNYKAHLSIPEPLDVDVDVCLYSNYIFNLHVM